MSIFISKFENAIFYYWKIHIINPYGEYFYDQVFLFKVRDTAGPEAENKLLLQKSLKHSVDPEEAKGVYRNKLNFQKLTYKHLKSQMLVDIKDRYKYEEMNLVIRPTQKSNTTTTATTASTKSSK